METEEIDIFPKIKGHNPSIDMSTPTTTPPMWFTVHHNRICGVMVSVLASSAVDRRFQPKTKDYKIGICCFSTKHAALRRRNKD